MRKNITLEQIRTDNPHFGTSVRVIAVAEYRSKYFDYTHRITFGSVDSYDPFFPDKIMDAWATYLWSPSKNQWDLGAN